jgi:hypothetical protein
VEVVSLCTLVDRRRGNIQRSVNPGIETISHLRENGRITILFSAFEGPPRIARLFGKGSCIIHITQWDLLDRVSY